jgi:hypothetical protein
MALPGVVSVGIGVGEYGSAAIVVGLVREERETLRTLPKRLEGFEVRVEIVGQYRAR